MAIELNESLTVKTVCHYQTEENVAAHNKALSEFISLDSGKGRQLLNEARIRQGILMEVFDFQAHCSHCGVQSLALLLAASECGKARPRKEEIEKDIKRKYQGLAIFSYPETRQVITEDVIPTRGVTLEDVSQILRNHGHRTTVYFGQHSSTDEFRRIALEALRHEDSSVGIIVNYQRYLLGQTPQRTKYGHHSPLCAYHDGTDRFLVLDTNITRPRLWLKAQDLFEAMLDLDNATGKSRGFVVMNGNVQA